MPGLVADIGSTNARFSLVMRSKNGRPVLDHTSVVPCHDVPSLEAAIRQYLEGLTPELRPRAGTLAVAAPVSGDAVTLTNNRWHFSIDGLRQALGFEQLYVINDFTAISLSLLKLSPKAQVEIGPKANLTQTRTAGVIGPGTGLGVGALLNLDGRHIALPSEGGHANFAPQTDTEWAVSRRLAARFGHVSNERLLSGPGLLNIATALAEIAGQPAPKLTNAEVVAHALSGDDPLCRETLDLFCAVLGSAAGDLALMLYADVVFIAGGIAPRFIDFLRHSTFRARFEAKGRFSDHMATVSTVVITEEFPGLIGAAAHLLQHTSS